MSARAKTLYEYAVQLEQIRVNLIQYQQVEAARALEGSIELLRGQAEIEVATYIRRYGIDGV